MPSLRLFIAADIGAEQRAAVEQLIEDLKKGTQFTKARPRWVSSQGLHLTLKFLGNVDSDRVDAIVQVVESAVVGFAPFEFDLKGLGAFPSERRPGVLWIGVKEGKEPMIELARKVQKALKRLGFPPERRPFHPHLTLARIKSLQGTEAMMEVVRSHRKRADLGEAGLDHLTLYQSHLSPSGATYTVLHRWPLREE